MRKVKTTGMFDRDFALMVKRGHDISKLKTIMSLLVKEEAMPAASKDHPLRGKYKGRRDCHIEPDWILIYKLEGNTIIFERMGTHSDLFR
ncbi:MAG: type II toxin-antitoxin system YafQ family toxin [Deltaproteobacteria bacterium]|nr:type II toxin-antitoxin system YafQ family toxin [Deltaproteobacteria bacterium]